jgi:hypothetical protein
MLTEKEQKEIVELAKTFAKAYYDDKTLAKRIGQRFNSKTKAIQQAQNKLIEYLKEAG